MKKATFSLFFTIFAIACATAQGGIISETQSVVDSNGVYYLKKVTLYESGTPFPKTVEDYETLGDSTAVTVALADRMESKYNEVGIGVVEAFKIRQARQLFNALDAIITTFSGVSFQDVLNSRYAGYYGASVATDTLIGQYRINSNGAPSFGKLVRLANGNYRLRLIQSIDGPDVSPQVQYTFNPRSKGHFRMVYPVGGTTYSLWLNTLESAPDRLSFFTLETMLPGAAPALRSVIKVR